MKYLSRNDLETISGRVIAAYKRLPAISDQAPERVDIDFLCQELLGLRIDYARLSLNGEKIGLTSSCDIGVEVFPEDPSSTEEQYYMLDGKTILIESDLMKEGANIGRRNYTVSHESWFRTTMEPKQVGVPFTVVIEATEEMGIGRSGRLKHWLP